MARKNTKSYWLWIAAIASFLVMGAPYWALPYHRLNLPDALLHFGLLAVIVPAVLLVQFGIASFWRVTCVLAFSVVAVVLSRVVFDGVQDPTSHNLWPFEVGIAFLIAFPCALGGASVGYVLLRAIQKASGNFPRDKELASPGRLPRSPGVRTLLASIALGVVGTAPLLLYIAFGPADGNPIGLGLLAMLAVPVGVVGAGLGLIQMWVEYFTSRRG